CPYACGEVEVRRARPRLEVHAVDRGRAGRVRRAVVVAAMRPVEDRLHLERVVELRVEVVLGPVVARTVRSRQAIERVDRNQAVDLRGEEVVDARARGTV